MKPLKPLKVLLLPMPPLPLLWLTPWLILLLLPMLPMLLMPPLLPLVMVGSEVGRVVTEVLGPVQVMVGWVVQVMRLEMARAVNEQGELLRCVIDTPKAACLM
jgi:hypothetical protein